MGLFSRACENPDCNARVKTRAEFCSKCGWAGPDSLTTCPDCRKRVGRTSLYCWSCGADLRAVKPPRIVGDRWVREEAEFAVRVDSQDLQGFWKRKVTVEPGTVGLVEKRGRITKDIPWGTATLEEFTQITAPATILLVSTADAVLRPSFRNLYDAKGASLDVKLQLILRVTDYEAFVRQFFEGHKRRVTYAMLEEGIAREMLDVTRGLMCACALEDVYGNLAWRNEFEAKLRDAMSVTLARYGLDLLQLNFVEFGGEHYEQLMQDRGEIYMGNHAADHLAEQITIRRRVAQLESEGQLATLTGEKDLADKIEALDVQYGVKSLLRRSEREETIKQALHELEVKNKLRAFESADLDEEHRMEAERIQSQHQHEIAASVLIAQNQRVATQADFEREQARLANAQTLDIEWQQSEQRRRNLREDALQHYSLIIEESGANLAAAKNRTAQRLVELDAEKAEKTLRVELLERIKRQEREDLQTAMHFELEKKKLDLDMKRFEKEKDTEVALASIDGNVRIAAGEHAVKSAVAEERAKQLGERLDDQKADKQAIRDDAGRHMSGLVEMGKAAAHANVAVIPGVGGLSPLGGVAGTGTAPCPNCGRPVELTDNFCGKCGHNMVGQRG